MNRIYLLFFALITLLVSSCSKEPDYKLIDFADFSMVPIMRQLGDDGSGGYPNTDKVGSGDPYIMKNQGDVLSFLDMSVGMTDHKFIISEGCEYIDTEGNALPGLETEDIKVHVRFTQPGIHMVSVRDNFDKPFKFAYNDYRKDGTTDFKQAGGGCWSAYDKDGNTIKSGDIVNGEIFYTIYIYVKEVVQTSK